LLGQQVEELQAATAACAPQLLHEAARPAPLALTVGQRAVIAATLASSTGRVCVAETSDITLVEELRSLSLDVYAVDPTRLPPGRLGAVVLLGLENQPAAMQLELLDRSVAAVRTGGWVIVASVDPRTWDDADDGLRGDLAVGRPLRASTWRTLAEARGLTAEISSTDPPDVGKQSVKLAERLLGPGPYVVALRRPAEA
jgi:hypothetical protein